MERRKRHLFVNRALTSSSIVFFLITVEAASAAMATSSCIDAAQPYAAIRWTNLFSWMLSEKRDCEYAIMHLTIYKVECTAHPSVHCAYCAIECNTLFAQCNYIFIEYFRNRSRLTFRVHNTHTHIFAFDSFFLAYLRILFIAFSHSLAIVIAVAPWRLPFARSICQSKQFRPSAQKNWSKPGSSALDRNTIAWTRRSALCARMFSRCIKQQKRLNCIVRLSRLWYFDYLLLLFLPFRFAHFGFGSLLRPTMQCHIR